MGNRKVQIIIAAKDAASKAMKGIKVALVGLAAAAAAAGIAFVAFTAFMKKAVDAANVQEKAEIRLQNALKSLGKNTKETRKELQEFASGLQEVTTFGDEAVLGVEALLISLGGLTGEGLKRATKATLDMAATLNQDLTSASIIMAKAAGGMVSSLSRYGVVVDTSKSQTEQFAEAISIMERKMGGAAAILSQTFEGALKQTSNAFGDLQESIGFSITKSEAMVETLQLLRDSFARLAKFVEENDDFALSFGQTLAQTLLIGTEAFNKLAQGANVFFQLIGKLQNVIGLLSDEEFKQLLETGKNFQLELLAIDDAVDELQKRISKLGTLDIDLGNTLAEQLGLSEEKLKSLVESSKNLGITLRTDVLQAQVDLNNALELANLEFDKNLISSDEYKARLREVLEAWQGILGKIGEISERTFVAGSAADDLGNSLSQAAVASEEFFRTSDQISPALQRGAQQAAFLGATLTRAALDGTLNFKKFFKQLLKDIAAAIVKALILKAILGISSGGAGFFFKKGGVVPGGNNMPEFQHGGIVTGGIQGRDSVHALLTPGEMVIPKSLTDAILSVANQRQGSATFNISRGSDIEGLMEDINFAVERRGFRLVATETV